MAGRVDITIRGNEEWTRIWQFTSEGIPVSISNYDFRLDIKYAKGPTGRLYKSLTIGNGITKFDINQGKIQLDIAPQTSVTKTLVLVYDLIIIYQSKNYVMVEGTFTIEPGSTYT